MSFFGKRAFATVTILELQDSIILDLASALNSMIGGLIRGGKHLESPRDDGHVKMEAEAGEMLLQTQEPQGPPEAGIGRKILH